MQNFFQTVSRQMEEEIKTIGKEILHSGMKGNSGEEIIRQFLKKYLPISGIRLTTGVQNAFTFTKYTGYDPEVGTSGGVPGFDNGRYPSSRMYTFSAAFDF